MREKDQEIDALQEKVDHLRAININMGRERREQQAAQEAEVSKLQKSLFQNITETRWQPMDDAVASRELDLLQTSISQFAKRYAIAGFQGVKPWSSEQLEDFAKVLHSEEIAHYSSEPALLESLDLSYGPRLCLNALLSSAVYKDCFQNPFMFLGHYLRAHLDSESSNSSVAQEDPSEAFFGFYTRAHYGKPS